MLRSLPSVLTALLLVACGKTLPYPFYSDWIETDRVYQESNDPTQIRKALVEFLARAESNKDDVAKEKRLNNELVIGESWLRLSAICNSVGDTDSAAYAMDHAIAHFDRIEGFARDESYQKNKRAILSSFLTRLERARPPRWHRNP